MEFNISRFYLLLKKDFSVYRTKILLTFLVMVLVAFLAAVFGHYWINFNAGGGLQGLFMLYLLLLIIGGGYLTSTNLGDLRSIKSRMSYIALPVSTIEKLMAKWLYTLPIYAGMISLIVGLYFQGYLYMYGNVLPSEALDISDKLFNSMSLYFLRFYVFGHAIAFFFSFFFDTYAAIKGALISIGSFVAFCAIRSLFIQERGLGILENVGQSIFEVMQWCSMHPNELMLVAPILYAMSYWVFKRKEA